MSQTREQPGKVQATTIRQNILVVMFLTLMHVCSKQIRRQPFRHAGTTGGRGEVPLHDSYGSTDLNFAAVHVLSPAGHTLASNFLISDDKILNFPLKCSEFIAALYFHMIL